jgi:hypothetical protein
MSALTARPQADATAAATIIIGIRVTGPSCPRLKNLIACLQALERQQHISRTSFRILIVEQDREPRCPETLPARPSHLFAFNPGPFNRAWGLNIGANVAGTPFLCMLDADLIVPPDFVRQGLLAWRAGHLAVRPYLHVIYLDAESSERLRQQITMEERAIDFFDETYRGGQPENLQGGCLWIDTHLYRRLGGHDERFEGWGHEDREFWYRLEQVAQIHTIDGRLLHLSHPRSSASVTQGRANKLLLQALKAGLIPAQRCAIGDPNRYRSTAITGTGTSHRQS